MAAHDTRRPSARARTTTARSATAPCSVDADLISRTCSDDGSEPDEHQPGSEVIGMWRSLVAHLLWEQGVGSSNLPIPTTPLTL